MADDQEKNPKHTGQPQSGQQGHQQSGQSGQQPGTSGQESGQQKTPQDPTKKNPSQGGQDVDVDDEQDDQQGQRRAS
jgi:hypothetical protein